MQVFVRQKQKLVGIIVSAPENGHFSKTLANIKPQNCCELIKPNDTILLRRGYTYLTPRCGGPIRLHCAR